MRLFAYLLALTLLGIFSMTYTIQATPAPHLPIMNDQQHDHVSIIIEVEGDPHQHADYLKTYYPFLDVVAVYDLLLNGLAIQGKAHHLEKLASIEFIKAVHPVQVYHALPQALSFDQLDVENPVMPADLHNTPYTGKGVKVAVIDTGIDYRHPDLQANYKGGYDVVDLDDDPMETLGMEGISTSHGTHVAGIIAANGKVQGVAKDAEIYAYRALGPGGQGTSVQVIAAMEMAVKDGVHIMNLSLGNSINGPDYPTSLAVNRATELGVAVVIANGNSGPETWTVGSPATASHALSVGAAQMPTSIPFLYESFSRKSIEFDLMFGSKPWDVLRATQVVRLEQTDEPIRGKIAISERGELTFTELAKQAEAEGAVALLVYNHEPGLFQGAIIHDDEPITIPVAAISLEDGEWLIEQLEEGSLYLQTKFKDIPLEVASFSSRGPVTVNWDIKPDLLAPGTHILSTVPNGYQVLQGTSMAAPHVAGALALMKEAHPDWSHEKMIGALKTTAQPLKDETGNLLEPIMQGSGFIQVSEAINTKTIIYQPTLTFGKLAGRFNHKEVTVEIENLADDKQTYYFSIPNQQTHSNYITWHLPQSFTLKPHEKRTINIGLSAHSYLLEEGIHQGWLKLHAGDRMYYLPYLFVNQTADYPRTMGFGFTIKPFSDDLFMYQLYVTEEVKKVTVYLYEHANLLFERQLLELIEPHIGLNEGELQLDSLPEPGMYRAMMVIEKENGEYLSEEIELMIGSFEP